jgi:hypothetical protein
MSTLISSFKSVATTTSSIIEGNLFYGIMQGLTFTTGQTTKYLLVEVPANCAVQYITQGLTLAPFDNTFQVRMTEGITSLTTGTAVINVNMNRNYSDVPLTTFTTAPVGTYGSEGTVLADFNPYIRQVDFPEASKILKPNVERILKANTKYLFTFTRTTDTTNLVVEFRWLWIEN